MKRVKLTQEKYETFNKVYYYGLIVLALFLTPALIFFAYSCYRKM